MDTAMRMSDYVVTRYYRAPELILGLPYSEKGNPPLPQNTIRMPNFSGHLVRGLYFRGDDHTHSAVPGEGQVTRIFPAGYRDQFQSGSMDKNSQCYGDTGRRFHRPIISFYSCLCTVPSTEGSSATGGSHPRRCLPYGDRKRTGPSDRYPPPSPLEFEQFPATEARDLLSKMIRINPDERYSVEESLRHPYVKLWLRDEEVNCPPSVNRYNQTIDYMDKPLSEWKGMSSRIRDTKRGFRIDIQRGEPVPEYPRRLRRLMTTAPSFRDRKCTTRYIVFYVIFLTCTREKEKKSRKRTE